MLQYTEFTFHSYGNQDWELPFLSLKVNKTPAKFTSTCTHWFLPLERQKQANYDSSEATDIHKFDFTYRLVPAYISS